jgi:hypothetical protein
VDEGESDQHAIAAPVDEPTLEWRARGAAERERPGADSGGGERAAHLLDIEQDRETRDADRQTADHGREHDRGDARHAQDAPVDPHPLSIARSSCYLPAP